MFLITCPTHDITTHYLSYFSKDIIDDAKLKGKRIIELSDARAVRKNVESYLEKRPVKFILFNGHGDDETVTGHKDLPLIESSKNVSLLDSKIVYCRSCSCAKKLGIDSIIAGVDAFIGFDDVFIFVIDDAKSTTPLKDNVAKKFLEPTNQFIKSLLKGHTVEEAYERSQKEFRRNIESLMTSETSDEDRDCIRYLFWDMKHHVWGGDKKAKYI